ncbi:RICIN domain-containing protein [uncultured Demequina sp.]|uniref:RICIN domain-containing protein n=1 Tax=uncultured Demequina sp. TaxID=693499 RepID=UPI00260105FD|nr:RICIN domain-containing protein [uncultured Demequina sp.]
MIAHLRSRRRTALITAAAVFAVLVGATASWGYWTSQATVTTSASSADLTVSTANFGSVTARLANESLTSTGTVTIQNSTSTSSTQSAQVTVTLSATGGDGYRGNFSLAVWNQATAACTAATPPASLVNAAATWASGGSFVADFTPGQSRTYCVRTTSQRATGTWPASGAVSFTPQVNAAIALGNYSGSASATASLTTEHLYPLHNPTTSNAHWYYIHGWNSANLAHCLDYFNAEVQVGGWQCKDVGTRNQAWRFEAVAGKPGYYVIRTNQGSGGPVMQVDGNRVIMAGAVSGRLTQQWTLQASSTSSSARPRYQLVSASTGQCVVKGAANGLVTMANCDSTANQSYLVVRTMYSGVDGTGDTISCAVVGGSYRITSTGATPGMRYEARLDGSTYTAQAAGGGTLTIDVPTTTGNDQTWTLEVYEVGPGGDTGTRVARGSAERDRSGPRWYRQYSYSCSLSGMG